MGETSRALVKVCVCGLGEIGAPTAGYIKKSGYTTVGYDIAPKEIKSIKVSTNLPYADIYVIAVTTGVNDFSQVSDVCSRIEKINSSALVCIESTVPVGTCKHLSSTYGLKYLVHCPHRYFKGNSEKYGVNQLRVFGSINQESKEKGLKFFRNLHIPLIIVEQIEIAEMSKIAENSQRFLEIAWAEELYRICQGLDLDFQSLREAMSSKWNIDVKEARDGIGGHCLPKDAETLLEQTGSILIKAAIEVDELYKKGVEK